jgi:hypothetical protein
VCLTDNGSMNQASMLATLRSAFSEDFLTLRTEHTPYGQMKANAWCATM